MTLEEVTTDDLVGELKRRYPVMVFAAHTHFTQDEDFDFAAYQGSRAALIFVLAILHADIMDAYFDACEDVEELP